MFGRPTSDKPRTLSERVEQYRIEVQCLVRAGIEHPSFEFTREASLAKANLKSRIDFVKLIQGLANAHLEVERVLVIGADLKERKWAPVMNVDEFDPARVSQVLEKYLAPLPRLEVFHSLKTDEGSPFVLIVLKSTQLRPVVARHDMHEFNFRKGEIWVKKDTSLGLASKEDFDAFYHERPMRRRYRVAIACSAGAVLLVLMALIWTYKSRAVSPSLHSPSPRASEPTAGPYPPVRTTTQLDPCGPAALPTNPIAAKNYSDGCINAHAYDFREARRFFEQASISEPDNAFIHAALAQTWSQLGYEGMAKDEAKIAFGLAKNLVLDERLWIKALYDHIHNDPKSAVKDFESLCKLNPKNIDYCIEFAKMQAGVGRGKDAITTLEELRQRLSPAEDDGRIDLAEADAWDDQSEFEQELQAAARAVNKGRVQGKKAVVAEARRLEGLASQSQGDAQGAKRAFTESKSIFEALGDRWGEAAAVEGLAESFRQENDYSSALTWYESSLDSYLLIGAKSSAADTLDSIADIMAERGNMAGALKKYGESLSNWRRAGDKGGEAGTLIGRGRWLKIAGDLVGAKWSYEQARSLYTQIKDRSVGSPGTELEFAL